MAAVRKAAGPVVRRTAAAEEAPVPEEAARTAGEAAGRKEAADTVPGEVRLAGGSPEGDILGEGPGADSPGEEAAKGSPEEGDTAAVAADRTAAGTVPEEGGLQELQEAAAGTGQGEERQARRGEAAGNSSLPGGAAAGRRAVDGSFAILVVEETVVGDAERGAGVWRQVGRAFCS